MDPVFRSTEGRWLCVNFVDPIYSSSDVHKVKKILREKNEKYYIMFITGIYLGLRVNEILKMRIGDVKGKTRAVFRQSKTGKECPVAYNRELIAAFRIYCEGKDEHEALIPTRRNEYKPLSRVQAYRILRWAAKEAGLSENIGTHTLRKTCGYHYYRQTKDLSTLMIWFNHRDPTDTLRYIGVSKERVTGAMVRFKI